MSECVHARMHVYLSVVFRLMGFEVLIQLLNLIVLITLCLPHCLTNQKILFFVFICKKSHSLLSLNNIEELLGKRTLPIPCHTEEIQYSSNKWEKNTNYLSELWHY